MSHADCGDWSSDVCSSDLFRADALPTIPPHLSIARRLIDAWLDDVAG
jgi:hypothetical protein